MGCLCTQYTASSCCPVHCSPDWRPSCAGVLVVLLEEKEKKPVSSDVVNRKLDPLSLKAGWLVRGTTRLPRVVVGCGSRQGLACASATFHQAPADYQIAALSEGSRQRSQAPTWIPTWLSNFWTSEIHRALSSLLGLKRFQSCSFFFKNKNMTTTTTTTNQQTDLQMVWFVFFLGRVGRIGCSSFVFCYSWFHGAKNMMIDEDACLVVASWQSSSLHLSLFWSFFPLWVDLHIGMLRELTSSTSCIGPHAHE